MTGFEVQYGVVIAAVLIAAAVSCLLLYRYATSTRPPESGSGEDLAGELDRLENVLRRDPHRDDMWQMYEELVANADEDERGRRRSFLEESGRRG